MFKFQYKDMDYAHKLDESTPASNDYEKHLHYFMEILYLVRGEVTYTVESSSKNLSPGDIVMIPPGKYHFATVNPSVPYERYVLKLPDIYLPDKMKEKLSKKGSYYPNSKKYGIFFNQMESYARSFQTDNLRVLFLCDTVKLLTMLSTEQTYTSEVTTNVITRIIDYIDENIRAPLTLSDLSDEFAFSKSYISNEFHKQMKIPIMQYVRAKKIIAAHQMIIGGARKNEVAEKFGFMDYSTFYRSYIKVMGFPPSGSEK